LRRKRRRGIPLSHLDELSRSWLERAKGLAKAGLAGWAESADVLRNDKVL